MKRGLSRAGRMANVSDLEVFRLIAGCSGCSLQYQMLEGGVSHHRVLETGLSALACQVQKSTCIYVRVIVCGCIGYCD